MVKDRLAIYTAIYGNTDILIEPRIIPENCDFYCFTDRKDITSKVYKIIYKERLFKKDTNRSAKYYKIFPHEFFPEYKYSLWIDARTFVTNKDIYNIAKDLLKEHNWAIFKHPERNTVFDEANICIEWGKDTAKIINKQVEKYKKEGFKDDQGLVAGTFIFRKHNAEDVINFEKAWWKEIMEHSKRDQLSFPYVVWKTDFKYKVIDKDTNNNNLIKVLRYKERDNLKLVIGPNRKNRIVVYSALFGNIDEFVEIAEKPIGCDFILFTNNKNLKLKNTEVRVVDIENLEYRKAARMFKLLPHRFLPEYEYSVWVDASIKITSSHLVELVIETLKNHDLSVFRHMHRTTLAEEVIECIGRKKDNSYVLIKQFQSYLDEGFQDVGLIESGVQIRRHMSEKMIEFNELWWEQVEKFSIRDQVSFPYVAWKTNFDYYKLGGYIWANKHFEVRTHNRESEKFKAKEVKVNRIREIIDYIKWYSTKAIKI